MFKSLSLATGTLVSSLAAAQHAGDTLELTLNEVVTIAKNKSTASIRAAAVRDNQHWEYQSFKSNLRPQLVLAGSLPNYSKTNIPVTQPDGTIEFKSVVNDNSQLNVGLTQNIGLTGGQVFVASNMLRFRDFKGKQTQYNGNPVVIGFNQPLFGFNPLLWEKKIEPLKYEASRKKYMQDMEMVGRDAADLFFNLLIAQINFDIASTNLKNNEVIFEIGETKFSLGRLSKDELLRLKLGILNARKAVAQAKVNAEIANVQLKTFIGISSSDPVRLLLPEELVDIEVSEATAVREALENRQETVEFRRAMLEAERGIAMARGEGGLNASLFGSFGLTNVAGNIPGIYNDAKDQQVVQLGFQIPILDWGRSASRIKAARTFKKFVDANVQQARIDFEQEIFVMVRQLAVIKDQMQTNFEADKTADERFDIANKRYMLGDLGITELNIALQEKDQARRDYIMSLRSFWNSYFTLRVLTLYDFAARRRIQ